MSGPVARALAALVLLGAVVELHGLRTRAPLEFASVDCGAAVELDGELLCGARAPSSTATLCERGEPAAIRPGDAITRDAVCERGVTRGAAGWGRMDPEALASLELPAQVNEASAEELDSLPGIGPVLAGRVIAARPIESVDALLDVRGIGPKKLVSLRPRARVRW